MIKNFFIIFIFLQFYKISYQKLPSQFELEIKPRIIDKEKINKNQQTEFEGHHLEVHDDSDFELIMNHDEKIIKKREANAENESKNSENHFTNSEISQHESTTYISNEHQTTHEENHDQSIKKSDPTGIDESFNYTGLVTDDLQSTTEEIKTNFTTKSSILTKRHEKVTEIVNIDNTTRKRKNNRSTKTANNHNSRVSAKNSNSTLTTIFNEFPSTTKECSNFSTENQKGTTESYKITTKKISENSTVKNLSNTTKTVTSKKLTTKSIELINTPKNWTFTTSESTNNRNAKNFTTISVTDLNNFTMNSSENHQNMTTISSNEKINFTAENKNLTTFESLTTASLNKSTKISNLSSANSSDFHQNFSTTVNTLNKRTENSVNFNSSNISTLSNSTTISYENFTNSKVISKNSVTSMTLNSNISTTIPTEVHKNSINFESESFKTSEKTKSTTEIYENLSSNFENVTNHELSTTINENSERFSTNAEDLATTESIDEHKTTEENHENKESQNLEPTSEISVTEEIHNFETTEFSKQSTLKQWQKKTTATQNPKRRWSIFFEKVTVITEAITPKPYFGVPKFSVHYSRHFIFPTRSPNEVEQLLKETTKEMKNEGGKSDGFKFYG
ncbi:hypothetical protein PVAND_017309 [Polypedilum vanderplanki]|uniref:Uncharacterized protein n=1 Tax=Polypedilum vanderplanki TaxID=319348 RepID=A0A9J6BJ30_POLVA|nr:hypothetical protein PVAND_017309 [Polypedilum vanderplanki]